MSLPIDINAGQFLAFAALALAAGVCIGIKIGIEICIRYGRSDHRAPRLSDCLEVR